MLSDFESKIDNGDHPRFIDVFPNSIVTIKTFGYLRPFFNSAVARFVLIKRCY